jgi:FkbM family methyltransferase
MFRTVWSDLKGLYRVCGLGVALRWLLMILLHLPRCLRTRRLNSADLAMGEGPVTAWRGGVPARLPGRWAVAHLREIWVRDQYLQSGFLHIPPDGLVLDLGANRGVFTALALACGPGVRVVSVEPLQEALPYLQQMLQLNHWESRVRVGKIFVGGTGELQRQILAEQPEMAETFISEEELIRRFDLRHIDLIKCDIEGSEYELFTPHSRLLDLTDQIAIELHGDAATRDRFMEMLRARGFTQMRVSSRSDSDCIVSAKRTPGVLQHVA